MLVWSENYETKIDAVDAHHQEMFQLLNKLVNNIQHGQISHEDIDSAIQLLIHHTKSNFHNEELLMLESHVDQRHSSMHHMEHQSFIYDIDTFSEISGAYDRRISGKVEKLVRFMTFWLTYHILGTDRLMAAQIANIKLGMSPLQAYESLKVQKQDPVTIQMIQDSLLNLWLESKEKCSQLEKKCYNFEKRIEELEVELRIVALTHHTTV